MPQPKGNGDSQPPLVAPENRQQPSRRPTALTFVASPSSSPKANSFEKEKAQVDSIPQILGVQSPQSKADAEREEKERWAYRIGFPRWVILRKAAKSMSIELVIQRKIGADPLILIFSSLSTWIGNTQCRSDSPYGRSSIATRSRWGRMEGFYARTLQSSC